MPRRGQAERLSGLQREILRFCKQYYDEHKDFSEGYARKIDSRYAIKAVAHKMGIGWQERHMEKQRFWFPGWAVPNSFQASMSRSLRNLIKKGIIEDTTEPMFSLPDGTIPATVWGKTLRRFRLTDKGKTLMLRIGT